MMTRRIPKKIRQQVYEKYDGHCAYCGCQLKYEDMQVDHINSVYKSELQEKDADNGIENLMPSCRQCNFYKSTHDINGFRYMLENTLTESVKKPFQFRLAEKYNIVQYTPHSIEFYFEKCERGDNND